MNGVGVGDLLVRMVVSLGVVLLLVFGAYWVVRRRQGFTGAPTRSRRSPLRRSRGASGPLTRAGLRIVGRVGVSRTSSVVAVQFADRVFMVGASDQAAPAVLAELDLDTWNSSNQAPEELTPLPRDPSPEGGKRVGILDALREATTRRG